MNDFRKFATKHLGMNGMALDDVLSVQQQYLSPIYSGGTPVERDADGRVLAIDDGPYHLPWHTD